MPVPVWAALLAVAVAKKAVVFAAAKVRQCRSKLLAVLLSNLLRLSLDAQIYGFPRIYRKSQQLARWAIRDPVTLKAVQGRIGYLYRAPNTLSGTWFLVLRL